MKSGVSARSTKTSCYESGSAKSGRCKGLALIMVLWIVAALSLLVVGMSQTVRGQVRAAQAVSEQVAAQALAEGAIALALQQRKAEGARPEGMAATRVSYGGVEMQVLVQPLSGLISLNAAQPPLLSALLQVAGGVPEKQADQLAHAIDTWRAGGTGDATRRVPRRQFAVLGEAGVEPGHEARRLQSGHVAHQAGVGEVEEGREGRPVGQAGPGDRDGGGAAGASGPDRRQAPRLASDLCADRLRVAVAQRGRVGRDAREVHADVHGVTVHSRSP